MGLPIDGPCSNWASQSDVELCPGCDPSVEIEPAIITDAIETSSFVLYHLSGKQYAGSCYTSVRPCRRGNYSRVNQALNWDWDYSWGRCGCGADDWNACGCGGLEQIKLGAFPIDAIAQVKIDGELLDPESYRVDEYKYLVRIDGEAWPSCQDLNLDTTEIGTFEVTFNYGSRVPSAGKRAAARLACELAKSYAGRQCKLPERVQSITRQGIAMTIIDPFDFLDKGKTGIYEVDLFLAAVNRNARKGSAQIMSPDIKPKTRAVNT